MEGGTGNARPKFLLIAGNGKWRRKVYDSTPSEIGALPSRIDNTLELESRRP